LAEVKAGDKEEKGVDKGTVLAIVVVCASEWVGI
jgi:hypothetical protein